MHIKGLQKLTLLDYKGYLAATLFTGSCNFICPFCHNKDLVLYPNSIPSIDETDLFHFLTLRKNLLEAVCITGGEPTLHQDLIPFIQRIRELGYKIKLDTNGTNPDMIRFLIQEQLVDYFAMDIKNSTKKYATTCGIKYIPEEKIKQTIDYIIHDAPDYEFRTTVVKELHSEEDILQISKLIQGAKAYYLQPYCASSQVINPVFSSYTKKELLHFVQIATPYVEKCAIIGL